MSKKYLDYDGLALYTEELKKWVLNQIQTAFREKQEECDDTKVYDSFSSFPVPGLPDVMYIDQSTGSQYVWDEDKYIPLTEAISASTISNIIE